MNKMPKIFLAVFSLSLGLASCNLFAPSSEAKPEQSTSGQPTGTTTTKPTSSDPIDPSSGSSKTSSSKTSSSSGKTTGSTTTTTTSGDTPVTPQDPVSATNPKTANFYAADNSKNPYSFATTTVYNVSTMGDIPYVKFADFYNDSFNEWFFDGGNDSIFTLSCTKVGDGIYRFYNPNYSSQIKFLVNTYADTLQFEADGIGIFNGSGRLYNNSSEAISYIANGIDTKYCKFDKANSKLIQEQKLLSFDFHKYGIDIVYDSSNNVYFPLQTALDLLFASNCYTFVYNGTNLYFAGQISELSYPNIYSNFVSTATSTYKNQSTRSTKMAEFTYNELCFAVENFYGLYKQMNQSYDSADAYFNAKSLKTRLKSTTTATYENALTEFVGKYLYDGHSGYLEPSLMVYNTRTSYIERDYRGYMIGGSYYTYLQSNARSNQLNSAYSNNWNARYNAGKDIDKHGGSFEVVGGDTAIIRFDSFTKYDLNDWSMDDIENLLDNDTDYPYKTLQSISTDLVFLKAFRTIKANSSIKNIVIDITCNGGGAADSIPWLEAFFTDDPSMSCYNSFTGEINEVHYDVDLNRDNVINSNDTYKDKGYKFFLMTSSYSFSCGNYFPTVIKENGSMTIIGQKSGGGECVVGYLTTATGSILRNSGSLHLGYYDYAKNQYVGNDGGIPVDYAFTDFYNVSALRTFCNSH